MKKIILILIIIHCSLLIAQAQWFTQQSGTTSALYDIEFINKNTGWCCGDGGYIIKTTNGGENWIRQGFGVTFEPLLGIHPVDSNVVYAAGYFRTLVKTTNGGENWIKVESGMLGDGSYECVFFINEQTGWMGNFDSPDYGVRKTTDGGQSVFTIPFNGFPQDLFFKDSLNGIGVSGSSYIYKTTNGGLNWNFFPINVTGDFYRVTFINENTGFTASRRAAYKTTNFGTSWDSIGHIPVLMGSVTSVEFCNEKTGWAGTNSPVYKTTNGGGDWFLQFLTGVVYSIYSYNDSLVWTCGNGGRIWNTTNGGISSIQNISNETPEEAKLHQNYPNPFNSRTKISFSIKKFGNYSLEIYNNLGQRIIEIFNKKISDGVYEITFDASDLNSGVYFYRLNGNNLSLTRKFILIK